MVKVTTHLPDVTRVYLSIRTLFLQSSHKILRQHVFSHQVLFAFIFYITSTIIQYVNRTNGSEVNSHKHSQNVLRRSQSNMLAGSKKQVYFIMRFS